MSTTDLTASCCCDLVNHAQLIMVTGDHPLTAEAIAKQVSGALFLRY
jgi:hypothetical protein